MFFNKRKAVETLLHKDQPLQFFSNFSPQFLLWKRRYFRNIVLNEKRSCWDLLLRHLLCALWAISATLATFPTQQLKFLTRQTAHYYTVISRFSPAQYTLNAAHNLPCSNMLCPGTHYLRRWNSCFAASKPHTNAYTRCFCLSVVLSSHPVPRLYQVLTAERKYLTEWDLRRDGYPGLQLKALHSIMMGSYVCQKKKNANWSCRVCSQESNKKWEVWLDYSLNACSPFPHILQQGSPNKGTAWNRPLVQTCELWVAFYTQITIKTYEMSTE